MTAFALEVKNGIDHVFENSGARDCAFLGHVSYEDQRETAPLGETDQRVSRASYLRNRAGSGFEVVEIHGLDGIDDDKPRRIRNIQRRDDIAHVGGCGELNRCFRQPQPIGAHPDLVDRFLARDIGACRFLRDCAGHLEKDRRFADARITAQQDGRPGY